MGNNINDIYLNHIEDKVISKGVKKNKFFNNKLAETFDLENIKLILSGENILLKNVSFLTEKTNKKSMKKNKHEYKHKPGSRKEIILTSSGMCSDGKILEYLDLELENKRSLLWLTGYQSGGTNGDKLSKLYKNSYTEEEKQIEKLYLEKRSLPLDKININIDTISDLYSGHIFTEDLIDNYVFYEYNSNSKAKQDSLVFLNHGGNDSRREIKEKIIKHNAKYTSLPNVRSIKEIILPEDPKTIYDLDTREWKEVIHRHEVSTSKDLNNQSLILAELKKQTRLMEEQNENIKKLLRSTVLPI